MYITVSFTYEQAQKIPLSCAGDGLKITASGDLKGNQQASLILRSTIPLSL